MAHAGPAQCLTPVASFRACHQLRGACGRIRIDERLRRGISPRNRTHAEGLLSREVASFTRLTTAGCRSRDRDCQATGLRVTPTVVSVVMANRITTEWPRHVTKGTK